MAQMFTSANTSINAVKLPTTFTKVKEWVNGTINLDYGGGKFENATEYLADKGVTNYVFDPFNRSCEHNTSVLETIKDNGGADTITCNNVLNVIDCDFEMEGVIQRCNQLLKKNGTAYFKIYEGDKSGNGKATKKDCYQRNLSAKGYVEWISLCFGNVVVKGDIIIAKDPTDIGQCGKAINVGNGTFFEL